MVAMTCFGLPGELAVAQNGAANICINRWEEQMFAQIIRGEIHSPFNVR